MYFRNTLQQWKIGRCIVYVRIVGETVWLGFILLCFFLSCVDEQWEVCRMGNAMGFVHTCANTDYYPTTTTIITKDLARHLPLVVFDCLKFVFISLLPRTHGRFDFCTKTSANKSHLKFNFVQIECLLCLHTRKWCTILEHAKINVSYKNRKIML